VSEPLVTGLGQVAMYVSDLPRTVAFYRDQVGVRFLFEAPPSMAFFQAGGTRLLIGAAPVETLQARQQDQLRVHGNPLQHWHVLGQDAEPSLQAGRVRFVAKDAERA